MPVFPHGFSHVRNLANRNEEPFNCTGCGLCCRHIAHLDGYGHGYYTIRDRGDGVCVHLATDTNRCRIYEHRPVVCDIRMLCPSNIALKDWHKLSELACKAKQKEYGIRPDGSEIEKEPWNERKRRKHSK